MPNEIKATYPYSHSGEYTDSRKDLDQCTALSFVASKTDKIRLMTGISVIPYRNPFALASAFATLDYLSKGRLDVGVGVGWMKEEFDILHVPFKERGEIADETLRILKVIWTESNPRYSGNYFHFSDVHFSPRVVQKPHPPIWVGGESPRAMRRAVELGDGWFPIDRNEKFSLSSITQLSSAINRLKQQLKKVGRKKEDLRIGYFAENFELVDRPNGSTLLVGTPQKIIADVRELEVLGISFIALNFLRANLEKTKAYSERFSKNVMDKL